MIKTAFISANNYTVPYQVYPLGVSYLKTYLKGKMPDREFDVFDCNMGSLEDLAQFCHEGNYELICISLRNIDDTNIYAKNCFVAHYREVMKTVRANSRAKVEIGGPAFSIFPELLFNELKPDWGIKGEGEESLRQLIAVMEENRSPLDIEGLVWRDHEGQIHINDRTDYISAPQLHVDPQAADFYYDKSGMLNIQTKRGCPYHCIYCSYPIIDGRRVRTLDVKTIINNIEELYFNRGIDYLFFTDSIFNIHKDFNEELCNRLIESKAKIRWGAYFAPNNLTREDLELYQRAGLTHIEWGTDSFSDRQLENYGKEFRFADIERHSKNASELGIYYAHFLILGGYGETPETLAETFENSKRVGSTVIFPYVGMRIYPRTELCTIAIREGVIKSEEELIDPRYYVSKAIDINTLKPLAEQTGVKWIFPDHEQSPLIERFRAKKRRGPLWEYLRF